MDTINLRPGTLLAELPPDARGSLLAHGRRRLVVADEVVVRQGELGSEMFVIVSGSFRVTVGGEDLGIARELRSLGPGDCFGEIAVLAGSSRSATVTATEPGELVTVSADDFRQTALEEPALMLALCRVMARRLESLAHADRHVRLVHPEDFPDAPLHVALLTPRVSSFCRAIVLDAAADRAVVAMVDPYDAPRRTLVTGLLRGRRVELVAIAEEAFARFAGLYLRDRSALDAGDMFTPEVTSSTARVSPRRSPESRPPTSWPMPSGSRSRPAPATCTSNPATRAVAFGSESTVGSWRPRRPSTRACTTGSCRD